MCLAQCYIEQLHKLNESITETFEGLSRMLSSLDKELSAVYHEIEGESFDVYRGYELAKRAQDVLKRRRVVKDELARMNSVGHTLDNAVKDADKRYRKISKKSEEIRRSLNVTMTFHDLVGEINITEELK